MTITSLPQKDSEIGLGTYSYLAFTYSFSLAESKPPWQGLDNDGEEDEFDVSAFSENIFLS